MKARNIAGFIFNMNQLTTNSLILPKIGFGTWLIGGNTIADTSNDNHAIETFRTAIEMGYTHFDTAELYGNGHTETLLGKAIKHYNRSRIIITSKVTENHLKYFDVLNAAENSLKRLQTDYLDVYLIHKPNHNIPIEETMNAMNQLVATGKVKHIGVSNFNLSELKEAQRYSKYPIVVNQIEYNLTTRNQGKYGNNFNMELETIPYCQKNNITVVTEKPFERGLHLQENSILNSLSEKYQKTKAQIILNWLTQKPNLVTIPMSTNRNHLQENLESTLFTLAKEDLLLLDHFNIIQ